MRMGPSMHLGTLLVLAAVPVKAQTSEPLKLEKSIELPGVQGRIDHMSIDVAGQRLFVSALGNNTVEVVDLKAGKRTNTISGLKEPQGALYVPNKNRLFVANGKDGTVKIFDGTSLQLLKTIEYSEDADNLRYNAHTNAFTSASGAERSAKWTARDKRSRRPSWTRTRNRSSWKRTVLASM